MKRENSLIPKFFFRLIYNSLLGTIAIIAINFMGSRIGFHISLNAFSILSTGFLGIPGLILAAVMPLLWNAPL
ncbi:MAG TPA: pro-sigmaK processing inhibitor BofA family protein [Clostridia bacterium]